MKRTVSLAMFVLSLSLFILIACAPKGVRLYETADTVRGDIALTALSLQGKPYRNGARGPDFFDCSGFVYFVFKQHRVSLPLTAEGQGGVGYDIPRDGVQPGDLVFFKIDRGWHVGITLNRNEFVHASKSRGIVVDSVDARYWRKRFLFFRSVL
ncbi:MAG: hypothetical protein C0399_04670 [Syntrophus sp. (in: bacteria)]|nr:hypothetical protein [Syntrophus sp. (in: bacteria)]